MLKKYFLRRFRSHFLLMFLPMVLVFLVIGYFLMSTQQKAIATEGPATLNSFEESLEASLYNMGYQLDVMMSNSSFSLSLKNLLSKEGMEQREHNFFGEVKNFLSTYELAYSYVHSIYLYIEDKEQFMTSSSGQIANINTYYDMEWLDDYYSMAEDERIFTSLRWIKRNTYDEPTEVISLYYRNTYLDGVIVINIDKSEYGKLLRNVLISERQKIFLINSRGDVVCTTDQTFEMMEVDSPLAKTIQGYIKGDQTDNLNNQWISVDQAAYFISLQYSDYLDIYQVSAIPIGYLFEEIRVYIILAVAVLILNLIIIIGWAYAYTKRSFYYIEECVNIFSAAERGDTAKPRSSVVKDEYSMILNNIIYLHLKSSQMQLDLMEKQHLYEMTEMMALQLQINPHFIFNTLQIMDIEVVHNIGKQSTLHKMIQQLSSVVKYALTTPTKEVTLREELAYLKSYLEIQRIRFDNSSITYFEVDDSVLDEYVFRLLLQPMLENCFEHGRKSGEERLLIKIKVFDQGEQIYFAVVDNGKGMNKEELAQLYERINEKDSHSIGLTNLNRRLLLHYGVDSGLHIQSRKGVGMVVQFRIPKKNVKKENLSEKMIPFSRTP